MLTTVEARCSRCHRRLVAPGEDHVCRTFAEQIEALKVLARDIPKRPADPHAAMAMTTPAEAAPARERRDLE